jgi:hypothetical protein
LLLLGRARIAQSVVVVFHAGGVRRCLWIAVTVGPIYHPPDDILVSRATVEWYLQGKAEEPIDKPNPVQLCLPHVPHGLNRLRTRASASRGSWLTAWAMARPLVVVTRLRAGRLFSIRGWKARDRMLDWLKSRSEWFSEGKNFWFCLESNSGLPELSC